MNHAAPTPETSLRPVSLPGALRAAILLGACLAVYAPVFAQEYAFTDDYAQLEDAHARVIGGGPIIGGRPLFSLALALGFRAAATVSGLAWLRLLSVLGLVTFAWVLHRHLERHGWSEPQALAVALACVALPGPMLFAAWATMYPQTWAMALAGVAFVLSQRADGRPPLARAGRFASATLVLTACFLTYQPTAPVFWVFFAVAFFSAGTAERVPLAVRSAAIFGIASGLGLVAVVVGKALRPTVAAGRTALIGDPVGKLLWFVRSPLVEAWSFVAVHANVAVAATAAALAAIGLTLWCRRAGIPAALGVPAAAALLLAAYAPNLAVAENFASFRTEVALSIMATVLAATALRGWASAIPQASRLLTPILGVGSAAFLLAASFTLQNYLVRPHSVELSWLRAALSTSASRVLVIPRGNATVAPATIHDELGFPSIVVDWSAKALVPVLMRERGLPAPQIIFPDGTNDADFVVTPGTIVVDADGLARMRVDYRP